MDERVKHMYRYILRHSGEVVGQISREDVYQFVCSGVIIEWRGRDWWNIRGR